jgi:hypothetical protein
MKVLTKFFLLSLVILISCNNNSLLVSGLEGVNDNIKEKYAPDGRVAIFDVSIDYKADTIVVSGETNLPKAHQKIIDSLQSLDVYFKDNIRILPDAAVGKKQYAIAKNSVINIRSAPKHSAELGTQALLGMPLNVLDKKGDFYRVQTPDNYISWVDKGGIQLMDSIEFSKWNTAKKVVFIKNFGYIYDDKEFKNIISDISLGGIVKLIDDNRNFYQVEYPDQRVGFIKKGEAILYQDWLNPIQENLNEPKGYNKFAIERTAKSMLGFPYLWGGTSAKGVDCSGFTKMVYFINGYVIPRDASQQIHAGKIVDESLDFSNLEKGDLLFFGKKATETHKQKVTHVGIWLGNDKMEFIHASGNVHISSMDQNQTNYDAFNKNRYLGSRRYLHINDAAIQKIK